MLASSRVDADIDSIMSPVSRFSGCATVTQYFG